MDLKVCSHSLCLRFRRNDTDIISSGAITPVTRGHMRNFWFSQGKAEYLSTVPGLDLKTVKAERDHTFGLTEAERRARMTAEELLLGSSPRLGARGPDR